MKGMTDKLISVVETATNEGEKQAAVKLDEVVEFQLACVNELLADHKYLAQPIEQNIAADKKDIGALLRSLSILRSVPTTAMEFVAGMGEVWSAQVMCAYLQS